jgi:sphingosine kinase
MDRKDYADALKHVKFGLVPAGSGNGLSKSTTRVSGLGLSPLNVAFLMCKGVHRPMDVFSCLQRLEDNSLQTTFGFLSLGWAVVSDIDFESEKWRSCCGGNRFLMTAVARLCCLRKYEAKLEYVRVPTTAEEGDESTRCTVRDSCPTCLAADAKQVEASMTALQAYRANPAPCSAEEAVGWEGAEETWEEMSDDFKVLWALNVPDASYEFFAAPRAHLADGAIDLVVFRGNMNCCNLLCAFPSLFDGSHTQHKRCEYVKVSALRLTPPPVGKGQHECKLCIDGEEIPYRPVEIRVFQGLLNVYGA